MQGSSDSARSKTCSGLVDEFRNVFVDGNAVQCRTELSERIRIAAVEPSRVIEDALGVLP